MKSKFNAPLIGQCESHSCFDDAPNRCTKQGKLYAVWDGDFIRKDSAHEYYYCEEAVEIDRCSGFSIEELQ